MLVIIGVMRANVGITLYISFAFMLDMYLILKRADELIEIQEVDTRAQFANTNLEENAVEIKDLVCCWDT